MSDINILVHLNEALAHQFLKLRNSEGKTISQMSKILGYNITTLHNKERNKSPINTQDLTTYATYFKLFPSDIVSMAEQDILTSKKENQCTT